MVSLRKSFALISVITPLLCSCLDDQPSLEKAKRDAGIEAGAADAQTGDANSELRDATDERDARDANVGNNPCSNVPPGTGCARSGGAPGVCTAFGACVECLSDDAGVCAGEKPHCTSGFTCVECALDAHCGVTQKCRNGSCIERCGDGVIDADEDCEEGLTGWTAANCDFATCKRTIYENCRGNSLLCAQPVLCSAAFTCFEQSDSNCVTSCPTLPDYEIGCASGFCYVDCAAGPCPRGTHCTSTSIGANQIQMCFGD